jgi:hypothetical protein
MASWFKEIVREKTPVELPDVAKFLETDLDQHDLCNELERKIENKGESPLQSDNRSDEKHSMAPNDPDSGDPQSIPIDNYTGSSRRKNMGSEDIPVTSPIIT